MSAPELLRAVGLVADGPAVLGRRIPAPNSKGVYVVELPAPLPRAPVDLNVIGRWIERVPTLRVDGERPTGKQLAARLAAFWLPSQTVLFLGGATSIAGRMLALERHILGDPRPHAAGHWLKAIRGDGLRVWWATTDAPDEYEDALFDAFAATVPDAERAALLAPAPLLPFANQRNATGERKPTGITGSTLPAEVAPPAPPTHVVEVEAGDADGARPEDRGKGTTRRAPTSPPPASGGKPGRVASPRSTPATRPAATPRAASSGGRAQTGRRAPDPVLLSADGLERLRAEHAELVARRPANVGRIRAAKELGDLKENSDYTAAREEQSFLEGRIQALEARLRAAVVVDEPAGSDRVRIGSTIDAEIDGERRRITIVGTTEADARAGRISMASPIGRAFLGLSAGDEADAATPGGAVRVRVHAIE
jgi:transcription elongation factor GreA